MKGDFSRDAFDSRKNFSRVLMQQGRVQLDADWNEQTDIVLHYLRTLASDLIGPHGGPGDGFSISFVKDKTGGSVTDILVAEGRYYVDGILCENEGEFRGEPVSLFNQPHYRLDDKKEEQLSKFPFLIYLDVWERHVTAFEDESLREIALNGIDTASRSQVVWQVKLRELPQVREEGKTKKDAPGRCDEIEFPGRSGALLNARAVQAQTSDDPCLIEPDARYRGAENQLYRVEIHTGNRDAFGQQQNAGTATFKWSRENGSVVFPVLDIVISGDTTEVALVNLGRDDKLDLREGDWVELTDDAYAFHNRAGRLLQIASIDRDEKSVTLNGTPEFPISEDAADHPLLRRWDQKAGKSERGNLILDAEDAADNAVKVVLEQWLTLEDGVQIKFPRTDDKDFDYRTGDYWLIPARTAIGDVVWAKDENGEPIPQPPHGVEHHYASLGIASDANTLTLCRRTINPIAVFPIDKDNIRKGKTK